MDNNLNGIQPTDTQNTTINNTSNNLRPCPYCGKMISKKATKCIHCNGMIVQDKTCPDCGGKLSPTDTICPTCGCPIESPEPQENKGKSEAIILEDPNDKMKKLIPIIAGGVAALIAVIVIIVLVVNGISAKKQRDAEAKAIAEAEEQERELKERAFEVSSEAYAAIQLAYEMTDMYGSDIYNAWKTGIFDRKEMSLDKLSKETGLSKDELTEGIYVSLASLTEDGDVDSVKKSINDTGTEPDMLFDFYIDYFFEDDVFSGCVEIVNGAYEANGTNKAIDGALEHAKACMKELSEDFSDYEHYPELKAYYTTVLAYSDFCKNPTGSFEQLKDTINQYKNEARDAKNDLSYIFVDVDEDVAGWEDQNL